MYTPEPKKPFFERLQERLAASRFLTFSALLHAVLVFLAGGVVLYKQATDVPDFAASDGGLVSGDSAPQAPPEKAPEVQQQQFEPVAPQLNVPTLSAITTNNVTTPTFQVAAAPVAALTSPTADAMEKAMQNASKGLGQGVGNKGIPGTMAGRMGGTARTAAMQMNGGKKESEEAVLKGLRFLVKTQNADGSWGGGGAARAAWTGFAMLSFLGHGETPVSTEFGPAVQKALNWILENGKRNGGRLSMEKEFTQQGVYAHGIVTYALGEYYTMTKDERAVDILKQAVKYVVDGQGPDGGWMYGYDKSESDTSVSGWQIQALKAAHLTGLNMDGVDNALDKAMLNLKRVQGPDGGYGYRNAKDERPTLVGVGVLCTYFWKQDKKDVTNGIEYIMKHTKGTPVTIQGKDAEKLVAPVSYMDEKANLYAWYYNTQACLMVGGAAWTTWNRLFQSEIVKSQSTDGSWPAMNSPGTGNYQKDAKGDGRFYRTNLCILMLEVYYRYMPTTK